MYWCGHVPQGNLIVAIPTVDTTVISILCCPFELKYPYNRSVYISNKFLFSFFI